MSAALQVDTGPGSLEHLRAIELHCINRLVERYEVDRPKAERLVAKHRDLAGRGLTHRLGVHKKDGTLILRINDEGRWWYVAWHEKWGSIMTYLEDWQAYNNAGLRHAMPQRRPTASSSRST